MDRRQFLKLTALAAVVGATESYADTYPGYNRHPMYYGPDEKFLLANANIVDVKTGTLMPEKSLLIRNGRIEMIVDDAQLSQITPDQRMDLGGKYLLPGLINAHCHMTLPGATALSMKMFIHYKRQLEKNAEECVKHGVTTVRDMMSMTDAVPKLKNKIAHGKLLGPRIVCACGLGIDGGYSQTMNALADAAQSQLANDPAQGKRAVKRAHDRGADFIKLFQQPFELVMPGGKLPVMDTKTVVAVCEQADYYNMPVAMHHTEGGGLDRGLRGGIHSFEHIVWDRVLTPKEVERIKISGATVVPTFTVSYALANNSPGDENWGGDNFQEMIADRESLMKWYTHEFCEPVLAEPTLALMKKFADPKSYEKRHLIPWPLVKTFTSGTRLGSKSIVALHEAGVPIGIGNDGGVPLVYHGAVSLEMLLLERLGIKTPDVIKMATWNNAKVLRMEGTIGSIEKGKVADLAVFDENPLAGIKNIRRPAMVFQQGRLSYQAT